MHGEILRLTAVMAVVVGVAGSGAGAQPPTDELVVTASSGTFRMPPLSSLVNETVMLDAERVAELALPALLDDATAAVTEIAKIDAEIALNAAAMEKEKEVVAKKRLTLQPAIDAYTRDQAALRADDEQLVKDQAPVQALIETYMRTPEKERTPEQYDRIAALKAPFDSRFAALKARQDALKTRFDAIEAEMTEQDRALAGMKKLDLELLARRQSKTTGLGDVYGQLRAAYD
jgi:hypothetical protein